MNDFERESSTMDMKEEIMSDAVDDAMEDEDEGEGEEAEGDKILKEVLDEIGMGMNDAVSSDASSIANISSHPHQLLIRLEQRLLL
jgi:charged multivesicular body protein 2A